MKNTIDEYTDLKQRQASVEAMDAINEVDVGKTNYDKMLTKGWHWTSFPYQSGEGISRVSLRDLVDNGMAVMIGSNSNEPDGGYYVYAGMKDGNGWSAVRIGRVGSDNRTIDQSSRYGYSANDTTPSYYFTSFDDEKGRYNDLIVMNPQSSDSFLYSELRPGDSEVADMVFDAGSIVSSGTDPKALTKIRTIAMNSGQNRMTYNNRTFTGTQSATARYMVRQYGNGNGGNIGSDLFEAFMTSAQTRDAINSIFQQYSRNSQYQVDRTIQENLS